MAHRAHHAAPVVVCEILALTSSRFFTGWLMSPGWPTCGGGADAMAAANF